MSSTEQQLQQIRQRIDSIDQKIQELINQRAACAKEVADAKRNSKQAVYFRPEREAQILRRVIQRNDNGNLPAKDVAQIFRLIMTKCLALQQPVTVAYTGSPKSLAHQATIKFFGPIIKPQSILNPEKLLQTVVNKKVNCGVLPLENSLDGIIHSTLEGLMGSSVKICGEIKLVSKTKQGKNNFTRFVIVGTESAAPSGVDKTSFLISVANKPGALAKILQPFANNQVNITFFESIPSSDTAWNYSFFVEIDGHQQEPNVQQALHQLTEQTLIFTILGSYPKAVL